MPRAKKLPSDLQQSLNKKKLKSAAARNRFVTAKKRNQVQDLLDAIDPSTLSFKMRTCPTAAQLKNAERDPIAALLSFAINSGLGRFSDADHLHTVFDLTKNPDFDSSIVPSEFKPLVAEIEAEITISDTRR